MNKLGGHRRQRAPDATAPLFSVSVDGLRCHRRLLANVVMKGAMSRQHPRLLGVVSLLAASGFLFFACSSSSSSSVSASQACADVAAARCQIVQQCNPQGLLNTYGSLSACVSTQAASCATTLAAPDTANTPAHTEGCAQATPSQSCDDYFLGIEPAACTPPTGPFDAGSACAVSGQCATSYCLIPKTAACGTCAEPPGAGDSCVNNSCGPGFLCDSPDSTPTICVAPVAASGACNDSSECAPGLTCIGYTNSALGACVALATTAGASCDLADGGSNCDSHLGLYCNSELGKICAVVATASATQPCGRIDGGVIDCLADSFCVRPQSSLAGTCVAPAADGDACDTANGPICLTPSRCVLTSDVGTTGICQTTNPQTCN